MVCAYHTNLGLSTLLFMARTNHMLHTECSNGAAIDCKRSSRLTEFLNAIAIHCRYKRFTGLETDHVLSLATNNRGALTAE